MKWFKENKFQIKISILIIIIFSIGTVIYYENFHEQKISNKVSDWAYFAGYAGLLVSIANLVILGIISVTFNLQNIKLQKPCLIFKISLEEKERAYYVVKNVGKGAAVNILVKHKNDKTKDIWDSSVICYSLGPDDEQRLFWKLGGNEWVAAYNDILDNHYVSGIKGDTMTFGILDTERNNVHRRQDSKALWSVSENEY